MKIYSAASGDVESTIVQMIAQHHPDLKSVRIGALFQYDDEESSRQTLTHGGYPAAATIRITTMRERVLNCPDAVIVIDRASWLALSYLKRYALIDHELTHLKRPIDEDTKSPKFDALGRPRLEMRRHDHQLGWFDEVAQRHGENSVEVSQARDLVASTHQLYFSFGPPSEDGSDLRDQSKIHHASETYDGKSDQPGFRRDQNADGSPKIQPGPSLTPEMERAALCAMVNEAVCQADVPLSLGQIHEFTEEQLQSAVAWAEAYRQAPDVPVLPDFFPRYDVTGVVNLPNTQGKFDA